VSKYFDKEMMEDALLSCIKRGADPKAVRLWFKLNDQTKIRVRTGAGMTRFSEVGAVVGQGMLGGAFASQAVLDDGVMEHLPPGGELQNDYGEVPLAPLMWLDDVLNATEGVDDARKVNAKVNILMKQRGLSLNEKKSICLVLGTKKQRNTVRKELQLNPLLCGHFETKEKDQDK
jgi:hypothetical protein